MANVTDTPDRGQLLLVAALGMAVLFVTLALTLNTAIYTENLATRGSDLAGGTEALQYRTAASEMTAGTIQEVNYGHNGSYQTLESNASRGVGDWNDMAGRQMASSAVVANTSLVSTTRGTRIYQASDRNFTDDDANATWTLSENVDGTRNFQLNVSNAGLKDIDPSTLLTETTFNVVFESGPDTWKVSIFQETFSGDINVTVVNGGAIEGSCTVSDDRVLVDITGETVAGQPCPELGYLDNVSGPYDIRYENANDGLTDTVNGTYELIVDKETVDPSPDPYGATAEPPHLTNAVYSATIRVTYNTTRLEYVAEYGVTPGDTLD